MSDVTEKNRDHFNNEAASYDSKHEKSMEQIIDEIQKRRDWIGVDWVPDDSSSDEDESEDEKTAAASSSSSSVKQPVKQKEERTIRLLDYACGTGLVSRALGAYVTQCIGIDISENMVSAYNTRASNQGLYPESMRATTGDLLSPTTTPNTSTSTTLSSPEFFNFDIAVVGLGFHHFEDPALAAKRLAERLKEGGVFVIVDFMPHHHHHHEGEFNGPEAEKAKSTVMHSGFSEEEVRNCFVDAGVGVGFEFMVLGKVVFMKGDGKKADMRRELFMARGTKGKL